MKQFLLIITLTLLLFSACSDKGDLADAYGNFESTDQLVTPEMPGKLLFFHIQEGETIEKGDTVALVDTTQLYLKKQQLKASIKAIKGKLQDPGPQIELLQKQIEVMSKELKRVESLLAADAATPKQLDDLQGKIDVLEQQIKTTREQSALANRALLSQIPPIETQILQLNDQIDRCFVINPVDGTVLLKLVEEGEMVAQSRALYKIANLSTMELRAYISGDQLADMAIGQKVIVEIDQDKDSNQQLEGEISWVSDRAEFTPKTIQTKEERVNLVYAIKVKVNNEEGILKIGMPGEVFFNNRSENKE
jgi:HlyD family secretion protein